MLGSITTSPSSSVPGQTISQAIRIIRTRVCTWLRFRQVVPRAFQI